MSRGARKNKRGTRSGAQPARRGLPAKKSVVGTKPFVSPRGNRYTIIETTEVDEYEEKKK